MLSTTTISLPQPTKQAIGYGSEVTTSFNNIAASSCYGVKPYKGPKYHKDTTIWPFGVLTFNFVDAVDENHFISQKAFNYLLLNSKNQQSKIL